MSGVELWRTPMGRHLLESTLPKVAHQLERLNQTIERLAQALQPPGGASPGADVAPSGASPSDSEDAAARTHAAPQARLVAFLEEVAVGYANVRAAAATGPDAAGERAITTAALEGALRAAFRMGVAAGQLARQDAPAPEQAAPGPGA